MGRRVKAMDSIARVVITGTHFDGSAYTEYEGPYATAAAARGRVTAMRNEDEFAAKYGRHRNRAVELEVATNITWKKDPA